MPTPTVRILLARRELGLGLLTPEDALPSDALDAPVSWVHSSDLVDPTPFLGPGQVLLTTGTQFGGDDSGYDGYVSRLVGRGVVALGFGTQVVRDTPAHLVDASLRHRMPLLEIPYRTPFIAVARYAADLVAEQAYARNTWALAAQRAVSLAALRPEGLAATLAELARQLGRWVALVDSAGALQNVFPGRSLTASMREGVEAEAKRMLRARRRAASTLDEAGTVVSLQTIGASDRLLGVLAHGGAGDVDQAAQQVVTSVVALAGLALEQGQAVEAAHETVRAALSRALGDAATLAAELGGERGLSSAELAVLESARSRVGAMLNHARAGAIDAAAEWPVLGAHDDPDARAAASALLAPLVASDPDGLLGRSLLVWLEHNGVYDAAARELGVHRHTLTARIRSAERLLGRDFGSFEDRVRVWAALRLAA
jgi:purine catabolism regulator